MRKALVCGLVIVAMSASALAGPDELTSNFNLDHIGQSCDAGLDNAIRSCEYAMNATLSSLPPAITKAAITCDFNWRYIAQKTGVARLKTRHSRFLVNVQQGRGAAPLVAKDYFSTPSDPVSYVEMLPVSCQASWPAK